MVRIGIAQSSSNLPMVRGPYQRRDLRGDVNGAEAYTGTGVEKVDASVVRSTA